MRTVGISVLGNNLKIVKTLEKRKKPEYGIGNIGRRGYR